MFRIIGVNLKSVIRMSQLVSKGMIEAKLERATIVNISSMVYIINFKYIVKIIGKL